ncbi:flagellar basal body-associated protein FliL [Roseobacter sp. SK209-2-6]|uniref:flagellar basal body-associated FliL family protein n=1 Tax=Roseobacter sp. SK209-2-6 TaxID=388739 RepID=UPI0000F3D2D6|nr:flagellar basal body-associated FliL family protein [Roseobacter sp. SK209-2-6]EBA17070.1 flagellar basal body-associated protein FliL [Roseobacter sp. SK209-2-6]
MTDAVVNAEEDAPVAKKSKLPMIIGVVLALVGGGGGFFAAQSGLLPFGQSASSEEMHAAEVAPEGVDSGETAEDLANLAFIDMEPIVITLRKASGLKHLRFRAQLEVDIANQAAVEKVLPRVVDVLNSYLRALELEDLTDPMALPKLRAQMLRRINIATGQGRVRDLLIMDFVLN